MTLHIPQKDSPSTFLTVEVDEDDTTLVLADSLIFQNVLPSGEDNTRLTLGFDSANTETVTVISYGVDNTILVERGTPSYSWAIGTKIARVFTCFDFSEIHDYLLTLDENQVTNANLHDHSGGDGGQIPSEGIKNGAITLAHMDDNSVGSNQIIDYNIYRVHLMNDIIDGSKIADQSIDSEHYVLGSIDRNHLSADIIDGSKIANNSINSEHYVAGSINPAHIANRIRTKIYPIYIYPQIVGDWIRPNNTSAYFGAMLSSTENTGNLGSMGSIPSDYAGNGTLTPIVTTFLGLDSGKYAYFEYGIMIGRLIQGGSVGSRGYVNINPTVAIPNMTVGAPYMFVNMPSITLPTVYPNDIFFVDFRRDPTNIADTLTGGSLSISGFMLSYTADS